MSKSPQLYIEANIKEIESIHAFKHYFVKASFKIGTEWQAVEEQTEFESFACEADRVPFSIKIDFGFSLSFSCKDVCGWPKMIVEIFGFNDNRTKHALIGYGVLSVPYSQGLYELQVPLFVPDVRGSSSNVIFKHKDVLLLSQNKFGVETKSVGECLVELQMSHKDMQLNGVTTS